VTDSLWNEISSILYIKYETMLAFTLTLLAIINTYIHTYSFNTWLVSLQTIYKKNKKI